MADEMTGTETSVATPAAPAQATPQTPAAPAGDGAGTAAGAGSQGAVQDPSQQAQANVQQTPMGALAAAAEGTQAQQQAQLLAGKFKTPQDLERGYLEAQKFISRSTQKQKELEERLEQVQTATQGNQGQQQAAAQDPVLEKWAADPVFGPLSQMPDPRYQPEEHREWVEKVFTPRFVNDPAGTINHMIVPRLVAAQREVADHIFRELQTRDMSTQMEGFFKSTPAFLNGKSVNDALNAWGADALPEYEGLLKSGVPIETAIEVMALRRGQQPLQDAVAAAKAKDQDLLKLASGTANRGAAPAAGGGLVGEGESFGEKMADSMRKAGMPLERTPAMPRNPFAGKKKT